MELAERPVDAPHGLPVLGIGTAPRDEDIDDMLGSVGREPVGQFFEVVPAARRDRQVRYAG